MRAHGAVGRTLLSILLVAVVFHVYEAFSEWSASLFSVGVFAWSLAPYALTVLIAALTKRPLVGVVSASLALALDVYTLVTVRYFSYSSTAALAFLAVPLWNLLVVVPLGAVGAFLWLKMRRVHHRAR